MSWSDGTLLPSSQLFVTTQFSDDKATPAGTVFEQYKLAVEMADRLSGRRQSANVFFLSVVSALTVANGTAIVSEWYWTCVVSIVTMLVCFMWWRLLEGYRAINSAKFKVIQEIEKTLPFAMFTQEEAEYESPRQTCGKPPKRKRYKPLSRIEQAVPALFAVPSLVVSAVTVVDRISS